MTQFLPFTSDSGLPLDHPQTLIARPTPLPSCQLELDVDSLVPQFGLPSWDARILIVPVLLGCCENYDRHCAQMILVLTVRPQGHAPSFSFQSWLSLCSQGLMQTGDPPALPFGVLEPPYIPSKVDLP